jgi:hypothetical protein
MQFHANAAIYTISVIATGGVIIRPWRFPEAIWAVLGAVALVAFGLISLADALTGILKGLDVYYFLAGMMLLAELARREGLFDWLATLAAEQAKGSTQRLFTLIYLVAIVGHPHRDAYRWAAGGRGGLCRGRRVAFDLSALRRPSMPLAGQSGHDELSRSH